MGRASGIDGQTGARVCPYQAFPEDLRGARGVFGVIEKTYGRKESPPSYLGGLQGDEMGEALPI